MEGCCECCTKRVVQRSAIAVFILAIAMISVGMWLPSFIRHKIDNALTEKVTLTPSTAANNEEDYRLWANNTWDDAIPYWYKVSVFNVTNPHDVLRGAKPNLVEIGPFIYRQYTIKLNITFDVDAYGRSRVQFKKWEFYVLDASSPYDDTETVITTLNMPYQSLENTPVNFMFVSGGIDKYDNFTKWDDYGRLFSTHTVREFLFGYYNAEIERVHNTFHLGPAHWPGVVGNTSTIEEALQQPYHQIYTGAAPYQSLMRSYIQFNNQTFVKAWATPRANRVYGSDGWQFPRYLETGMTLSAWVDDLQREVDLVNYDNETTTYAGIDLIRFKVANYMQQNASVYPPNADYHILTTCNGFLNNSAVEAGNTQVFMSEPHFRTVDCPEVLEGVTGLAAPNDERDQTVIDVEPFSGIPMHAWKRLQINVHVHPFNFSAINITIPFPHLNFSVNFPAESWLPDVKPVYWPIFWIEEGGVIPDDRASEFIKDVYGGEKLAWLLEWIGYIGGSILVCAATAVLFYSNSMPDVAPATDDFQRPLSAPGAEHY